MENYYEEAYKAGQKHYRKSILMGNSPWLPALQAILPEQMTAASVEVGLMNVPAEKIVGTLTKSRSNSFMGNFMPASPMQSEFAIKWRCLAESQQKEGIREPVLLYEYMNRYYVQEGNKRVSVLKFFGAVTVPAVVRRILPRRSEDPLVRAYYEFLEFSKISGITFLEFSEPGAYGSFCTLMGKAKDEAWDEDEVRRVKTLFHRFCDSFHSLGGEKIEVQEGDAFLACLNVVGFDEMVQFSEVELKNALRKTWEEILLQKESTKVEMMLNPEEQTQSMISKMLAPKKLKAAFLYMKESWESSWVTGHELARNQVQRNFEGKVETLVYICGGDTTVKDQLERAIADGADVIFATSGEMLPDCLKAAVNAPEVVFMNCTLNKPHRVVRAYYPRMHEAQFVAGAVAGAMCENGKVGYISKYPVYGSIAGINAFARGLKMTNPAAKLYLEWCALKEDRNVVAEMKEQGIQLIYMMDYQDKEKGVRHLYGLEMAMENTFVPLVLPVWNWTVYYEWILNSMLNGSYKTEAARTRRSLQYYWGMSSGAVKLLFAERLPKHVRYLGELLCRSISDGICSPFFEPDMKEDGHPDWDNLEQSVEPEVFLEYEELEDNILGRVPEYEELNDAARRLVDVLGIRSLSNRKKEVDMAEKEKGEELLPSGGKNE
ncbi:MAG: BMP family ABC transporter substrate-binding protein [Lachnospiraceae bacterium]|nr:BMP family ABC transporter substrate-binding protein [Lachnospiraceae bacterium]